MKPRLIILSDLWGKVKSDWIDYYQELLDTTFDLQYYDCCELGGVDTTNYEEASIHAQFVKGGIDVAVSRLLELEKDQVNVLAFSIGGTIAWKAGLEGLKIENLYAVSSTRLRYETVKPNSTIKLYFGNRDPFKPSSKWFENMGVAYELDKNGEHQIYTDKIFARKVCEEIVTHRDSEL